MFWSTSSKLAQRTYEHFFTFDVLIIRNILSIDGSSGSSNRQSVVRVRIPPRREAEFFVYLKWSQCSEETKERTPNVMFQTLDLFQADLSLINVVQKDDNIGVLITQRMLHNSLRDNCNLSA